MITYRATAAMGVGRVVMLMGGEGTGFGPLTGRGLAGIMGVRRRLGTGLFRVLRASSPARGLFFGRLAQLVRAPALHAGGRRFESSTAHRTFAGFWRVTTLRIPSRYGLTG